MAVVLSGVAASALADEITALVGASGEIEVYEGSLPSDLDSSGDTLLATFELPSPAAAAAVAGVATWDFDPDISATVAASGTAGYFVVTDGSDAVFGGTVGTSGADMNFSSVAWVASGTVTLTAGTVTQPTS